VAGTSTWFASRWIRRYEAAAITAAMRWEFRRTSMAGRVEVPIRFGGNRGPGPDSSWIEILSGEEERRQDELRARFRADTTALGARAHLVPSAADIELRERVIRTWRDLDPHPLWTASSPLHLAAARKGLLMMKEYELQRANNPTVDPKYLEGLRSQGSLERALDEYLQCLAEAPWQAWNYRETADLLVRLGHPDQAAACLELFLFAEPQASDAVQVRTDIQRLRRDQ
jgi:tetratricopeptide (TPR) repeat protein